MSSLEMVAACAVGQSKRHVAFACDLCGGPIAIALSCQAGSTGVCAACALQYEARGERPPIVKFGYYD